MNAAIASPVNQRATALMALGLMAVILMMVLPVPAFLLDIGLTP